MRYFLQKGEQVDYITKTTKQFFNERNIDISFIPKSIYEDLYHGLVADALNNIIQWRGIKNDVIENTLLKTHQEHRKPEINKTFYSPMDCFFEITMARFKVQLEKVFGEQDMVLIDPKVDQLDFTKDAVKTSDYLMDSFYNMVLDEISLDIKKEVCSIFGDKSWEIFDLISFNRNSEITTYGDFRIHAWDLFILK